MGDAVEASLTLWVDSPRREAGDVHPTVRELFRLMQRRAFEVTAGWDDIEERGARPPGVHKTGVSGRRGRVRRRAARDALPRCRHW